MTTTNEPTLGWLGVGRMGFELALRLLNAGHHLAVWNRTRSKAEPLASLGAEIVDQPGDLAHCDIVFSIVSSSEVFSTVMVGDDGVLTQPEATPTLLIDSSTVSMSASEQVRRVAEESGCQLLAAPVSGNPNVVKSGRLGVVVSGPRGGFERARQYLDLFGSTVKYVGEGERARLVKICHNLILGVVTQVLAETSVLAEKSGIDRSDYLQFINGSVMGSVFSRYKTPAMVACDYTPTFTGHLLRKDFELGLQAARDLDVPLPVSALVHQLVLDMIGNGLGEQDFSALLEMAARGAGLELSRGDGDGLSEGLKPIDDLSTRRPS